MSRLNIPRKQTHNNPERVTAMFASHANALEQSERLVDSEQDSVPLSPPSGISVPAPPPPTPNSTPTPTPSSTLETTPG